MTMMTMKATFVAVAVAAAAAVSVSTSFAAVVPIGDPDAQTPTVTYNSVGPIADVSGGTAGNMPANYQTFFPNGFTDSTPIPPAAANADFTVRLSANLAIDTTLAEGSPGIVPLFEAGGAGNGFVIFYNLRSGALGLNSTGAGAGNVGPTVVPAGTTDVVASFDLGNDLVSLFADGTLVGSAPYTGSTTSGGNGPSIGSAAGNGNIVSSGVGGYVDAPAGFINFPPGVRYYFDTAVVVPEPTSGLVFAGLGVLALRRRR